MKHYYTFLCICGLCLFTIYTVYSTPNLSLDSLQVQYEKRQQANQPLAQICLEIAHSLNDGSEPDESLEYLLKALAFSKKEGNIDIHLKSLKDLYYAYNRRGKTDMALAHLINGLSIADSLDQKKTIADFSFLIGDFYRLQHHIEPALERLAISEAIYAELGREDLICLNVLRTRANTYKITENRKKAIEMYKRILSSECAQYLDSVKIAITKSNLGSTLVFDKQFKAGEQILKEALDLKLKFGSDVSKAYTYNELASLHYLRKNYEASRENALIAYDLAKSSNNVHLLSDITENLFLSNAQLKNYDQAFEFNKKYHTLADSIRNEERTAIVAEMDSKYKSALKEKALANQQLELNKQNSRNRLLLISGVLLALLALSIYLWSKNRLRIKEKESMQMENLDKLKTRHFTNISHELRTPLSLIIDPVNQLKKVIQDKKQSALINTISVNANNMLDLVNQILDLSKLEAGMLSLNYEERNIIQTIEEIINTYEAECISRNINLNYEAKDAFLMASYDEKMFSKILNNLIANAVKFTPNEGMISIAATKKSITDLEITVSDNGIGISKDQLPNIFNRFYQVDDSATRNFSGSGVGLSLVKELTELHGGKITVESEEGKGSTFTILLPILTQSSSKALTLKKNVEPLQKIGTTTVALNGEGNKINGIQKNETRPLLLLIEDHHELGEYLESQLSDLFEVQKARNGMEGFAMALDMIPDIIVSDVMMPEMDGFELCRRIKEDENTAHIPILLLTAKSTAEEKIQGLNLGANDYLTKPLIVLN